MAASGSGISDSLKLPVGIQRQLHAPIKKEMVSLNWQFLSVGIQGSSKLQNSLLNWLIQFKNSIFSTAREHRKNFKCS